MAFISFKNKKKTEEIVEEFDEEVEVYHEKKETPFELSVRKFKKKQQRMNLIKNIFIGFAVFLILISMLRVFTFKDQSNEHQATALQSQTFVKRYIQNYFAFPRSEASAQFLNEFTLQSADNTLLHYENTKTASISNVEIYGVKQTGNDFVYNISGTLNIVETKEGAKEETQPIFLTLHTTQLNNKYLVTAPILLEYAKTQPISKLEYEDYKKQKQQNPFSGDGLDTALTNEVTTSIKLFFETWSKDIQQATILVQDQQLNPVSPGSKIDFESILSSAKNEKEIQLKVMTTITVRPNVTQKKVFTILIDRTSNKIKSLKEE